MRGGCRNGAGRPRQHEKVEDYNYLSISYLCRQGLLMPSTKGTLTWTRNGEKAGKVKIEVDDSASSLILMYSVRLRGAENWKEVNQPIELSATACHYGGQRKWFKCPQCGRNTANIYITTKPACRKCLKLVYQSQSETLVWRIWNMKRKIEGKLGTALQKPKGMHRSTRSKLLDRYLKLDKRLDDIFYVRIEKWKAQGWW